MLGGKNQKPLGYTIIEVMIVLAVSGVMFLIAANFINGKQARTAFSEGVNEMASRIQDTIEQVTDGQYGDIPFNCTASSNSGASLGFNTASGNTQGTNPSCVFVGKFFHLSASNDPSSYEVFSLAAARGATSLLGQGVKPVYDPASGVDLTSKQTVPQHLQLSTTGVKVNGAGRYYGFGFAQSQGTAGAVSGTYASGAQTISLVYGWSLTNSADGESQAASKLTGPWRMLSAKSAQFCLTDGTRYAQISVGDSSNGASQISVKVKMNGTTPC